MIRLVMTQSKKEAHVNKTFVYVTDSKISLDFFHPFWTKKMETVKICVSTCKIIDKSFELMNGSRAHLPSRNQTEYCLNSLFIPLLDIAHIFCHYIFALYLFMHFFKYKLNVSCHIFPMVWIFDNNDYNWKGLLSVCKGEH